PGAHWWIGVGLRQPVLTETSSARIRCPGYRTVQLAGTSPGGYVLDSSPGIYRNVLLLDFKSLYPSIIRSFLIDPCGMWAPGDDPVSGFGGATFARDGALLPSIVSDLGARRDQAKREQNQPLSQAIKIIMNSFYGVLGASGCRFVDPKLTSSITRRGHEVIQRSQTFIEDSGYRVIYGDTDSLFVLLPDDLDEPAAIEKGNTLAEALNQWWKQTLALEYRVESHLELEFEHLFLRFLMPTVRGTDVGTKKRYAGMVRKNDGFELIFKGLEVVRTDWTEIARTFQRELYRRVFENLPYEDYVQEIDQRLLNGEFDEQLVYRKRLRRPIAEYAGTGPPHVQAARKLDQPTRWVRYVITATGPEPVEHGPHRPDYEHYRQRQLAPVADAILHFLGTSYDSLTSSQLEIF
ncbi:MAG: DNA polymerase domain-containing protein, partial [Pseudomonadota bacterium]